jgi:Family of unknown function (DUF5694)
MRIPGPFLYAAVFLCMIPLAGTPVAAAQGPKTEVMIVGDAHLVNRRDVYNSVYTSSPLSAERQAQIADIIGRLARFHPNKVLIEAPFSDRKKYADQYRQYLAGRFTLGANEIYQYGFKLAKRSGDRTIYPIDTWGPNIYDDNSPAGKRIDAYLNTHLTKVDDPQFRAFVARDHYLQLHGTYLDELRYLNADGSVRANASWYSILDGMGRDADDAGSMYVAQWYTRNCYLFSNIRGVLRPGDRAVLFMGQGHKYLLREFVRLNPNLEYVDPLQYLN